MLIATIFGCANSAAKTDSTATADTAGYESSTMGTASTDTVATDTADINSAAPPAAAAQQENAMSTETTDKVAELHTTAGQIDIRFFPDVAPNHVKNFITLAEKGFYNGTKFHRVIPGFMIQGGDPNTISGDPNTWGTGGAGTNVKAEFNSVKHKRGIVSMARSQSPDSASSQFFIMVNDYPSLDNQYSAFGQVTKGLDVVDKIVSAPKGRNDRPNDPTAITKIVIRDAREDEKGPTPR
jgi:cyclophilin family peptidyl-prolyl cis-trans isomerase